MRRGPAIALALVAVVALVAAAVFATLYVREESSDEAAASEACSDRVFGHIAALSKKGDRYEMRFDPAWFTSGVTANTAAAEDGVVEPGEPVPNDNYRVDEGHRLLTYLVPPDTPVTVLTRSETGFLSTPVSVAELADLVAGKKPVELYEPLDSGVWARYRIDTACALDQQYQP